jgi:hypothetical protein
MAVQTTYNETLSAGRAGAIANAEPNVLISRNVETVTGVGFGKPVVQGSADSGCKITEAGDTAVLGVTVRDRSVDPANPDKFAQYANALVMTKGVIWVDAAAAVDAGDDVWVTVADGTFTNADAGGGASVQIANARWDSSTSDAGLAKVRLA